MTIKRTSCFILTVLMLSVLSGCLFKQDLKIDKIDGDITCEFRLGKDSDVSKMKVVTDAVFDKDEFIKLFNLCESYYTHRINVLFDNKHITFSANEQPQEFIDSEISVKVVGDGVDERRDGVTVFDYDSKLYCFVMYIRQKGNSERNDCYYVELPQEVYDYWHPIFEKVRSDDKAYKERYYGSFTIDRTYAHDKEYFAECNIHDNGTVLVDVYDRHHKLMSVISPRSNGDFRGVCWERDNYNLWIQFAGSGCTCYSYDGKSWVQNNEAVRPAYITEAKEGVEDPVQNDWQEWEGF